jgi:hypothetical protein
MKRTITTAALCLLLAGLAEQAQARIKLTTLPERETVRVDIKNGRFTLVEEERTVNLQGGRNQVDFSWSNISIDKDSIVFRVIKADGEVNVLNTNYPNNENALYWTVSAAQAGPAVIRISYLIGNMSATASYQGIVENDEKTMLLQTYMTVQNTSGEDFGRCTVQPGVGKTQVRYFKNGERKRMLASKFMSVPIEKRFVFDATVDQKSTRMYYRLVNDADGGMGEYPLPRGKVRLFIKEPKSDPNDDTRSQAFLGEDWCKYTPLFAPMDLYVGVAQDVKVERFTMQPEGGPLKAFDELSCPRVLLDGSRDITHPRFRDQRTRFRYRMENFKTANGEPITVPLTIKEHVDGEWILEKVVLKEVLGERNEVEEKVVPHNEMFIKKRIDTNNVEFDVTLPPTTITKKYDLYLTLLRKNRRHNEEPRVISQ